jgi:hypothetical protein
MNSNVNILRINSKVGASSVGTAGINPESFLSSFLLAIRKDNNTLIFKVDECVEPDAVARQHIVYEVNRTTKQVIAKIQLSSVFGMILGPGSEVILGIRQAKDSGLVQCYMRK